MSSSDQWLDEWDDAKIPDLIALAGNLSQLALDLLLTGETGTGKDTLAHRIHEMSGRTGRLVAMNCAAIPESLAESELFGVVSGAYTGADRPRMGYIEAAQGGTLYLDEIDSMPLCLQAKLLRVLESRTLVRLGSTSPIKLDICVIAAAQRALDDAVAQGHFRRDLYFRLNVLTVNLLPLRERRKRILPLFKRFVGELAVEMGTPAPVICPVLQQMLVEHPWPGNIRELKAAAKRLLLGFPVLGLEQHGADHESCGLKAQLQIIEKALIEQSLKRHQNCLDAVCGELELPRRTLYRRIKQLRI